MYVVHLYTYIDIKIVGTMASASCLYLWREADVWECTWHGVGCVLSKEDRMGGSSPQVVLLLIQVHAKMGGV
jgi:hypothetical protein